MKKRINALVAFFLTPTFASANVIDIMTSPVVDSTLQAGAHISAAGQATYDSGDPSVNYVELYVLADNANPSFGLITTSATANIYDAYDYYTGGGYRKFNSDYKVFNATKKTGDEGNTQYFVSSRPFNAAIGPIIANPGSPVYVYYSVPVYIQ